MRCKKFYILSEIKQGLCPFSVIGISLLVVDGMVVEIYFFQAGFSMVKYAKFMHRLHVFTKTFDE